MVACEQQHAVARLQACFTQAAGQPRTARGPLPVRGMQRRAFKDGGRIGALARLAQQQVGQGHGCLLVPYGDVLADFG